MANKLLLGEFNTVALDRSVELAGTRYLAGDTIVTDAATAKSLIENHYGEIVSIEWSKGMKMTGQSISFRVK